MTSTSDRRFVILKHATEPPHFDLMIEHEEGLWTWSLYRDHLPETVGELDVERIQDHRKAYLTYEGPVSGDRGRVRRVEEGTCTMGDIRPDTCFKGRFDGDTWQFPFHLKTTDRTGPRDNTVWVLTNTGRSDP
jgi:hypothetical protein